MIFLLFVMLLNSVSSPIQRARYIDVRISEFRYTFKKFTGRAKYVVIHTILRRCKLKPPQNGNLKKPIIDLSHSRNTIHMTYATRIFLKVF